MDTLFFMEYMDARDLAWKILLDNNVVTFPVNIQELINAYNITLVKNNDAVQLLKRLNISGENDACAIRLKQRYIIYNPDIYLPRLRFSLAHEFGHIVLGHIKKNSVTPEVTEHSEEQANIFASRLLAPAIVAKAENITTEQQAAEFFGLSAEAAAIRFKRFQDLYERDKFLTSPLEKEYFNLYITHKNK